MKRRDFLVAFGGSAASAMLPFKAAAQDAANWPDRVVKIIVPYPAGGSADVLARIIAEQLKEKFGQSFVVENRPGAGGNTGIAAVTASPADGYTIGAATVGHFAINQYLYDKMPYDPERDFIAATLTYDLPNVVVVATDHVPSKTVSEFVTWAKARSQPVSFGSPGVGTTPHLSGALFATRTGLSVTHVPFRGAAQTIPAMLSGDVTYAVDNLASYISIIESGKMRALAVTSAERWPTLATVPTMAEAGVPDFIVTSWAGLVLPAGTPPAIIAKLSSAMKELAADPAMQKRFQVAGARIMSSTPEEAAAKAAKERPMWQEVIKISGAKAQ
ncbi:MAG TPA: tripartite tricarboxylate transporter substrate binding protein [Xanthobacteraceae bacterium]|jgi:tripartite-type tricarboxylate transporter receptor subunit TctC|nr:tripartite tricarboxylate transporter substrate binding protein [Xanthobacteraceae bacterium]